MLNISIKPVGLGVKQRLNDWGKVMKLYGLSGACSLADHIALNWTGQPFEFELVPREQLKSPEFLAKNPLGSVPVLIDGEMTLTQNAAILGYIADSFPNANLFGSGTSSERAQAMRWVAFVNADIHPAYAPIFRPQNYAQTEDGQAFVKTKALEKLRQLYGIADEQLGKTEWLAGDFREAGDAYLFVTLLWAAKVGVDLSGYEHLDKFKARMLADESVQNALKTEGIEIA